MEGELRAVKKALNSSPAFSLFLKNPTISRGEKATVVNDLFDDKVSHITKNLFIILAANGRIADADKVMAEYLDLMETASGVVKATVVTAEPLQGKTLKSVEAAVLALVEKGKQVELDRRVDPSIIGGLQVIIGDKFLDLSVASRITTLSKALEGADA